MGLVRGRPRQFVGQDAPGAARPGLRRQDVQAMPWLVERRLHGPGLGHVGVEAVPQLVEGRILVDEVQGVGVRLEATEEGVRGEVQIRHLGAITVVVEIYAQVAQGGELDLGQAQGLGSPPCRFVEVVAEGADHRPGAELTAQVIIHQQAGTPVRGGVDVGLQPGVTGDLAGKMVIEIPHPGPCRQDPLQGVAILVQGQVEDGDLVPGLGLHPDQQADVPFDAGHQDRILCVRQVQLLEGAEAVGVAVEDIKAGHHSSSGWARGSRAGSLEGRQWAGKGDGRADPRLGYPGRFATCPGTR